MNGSRTPWPALIAVALIATLSGVRTLGGGFLSDDLLLDFFTDHAQPGMVADWRGAFADFARPWLDLPAPLYRPMVSVSMCSDLAAGGGSALPFHVTNLGLHVAYAVLCAALCARIAHRGRTIAALLGGAVVALHPIAVEPVAWIAARNSSLEIVFHALALLAFAVYLTGPGRIARAAVVAGSLLALCTKESAVVLPVSLLAVDWLLRPHHPLGLRIRTHLGLLPLWIGYVALRIGLLGTLASAPASPGDVDAWTALSGKLRALFAAPVTGSVWLDLLALPLWFTVGFVLLRARRTTLLICALWLGAHLAPTWQMPVQAGLSGSRLIYGALLPLAVLVGTAAARAPRSIGAVAAVMLVVSAFGGRRLVDRYRAAWDEMRVMATDLASHARDATPTTPLVLGAMPPTRTGVPPFNHNGWFAAGWPPQQTAPIRVVSAGYVTTPTPGAEVLHHDGSPLCALWEQGCTILAWDAATSRFLARRRPAGPVELPALTRVGDTKRFAFATPAPAAHLQMVTLRTTRGAHGGRLTWHTAVPDLPHELAGIDFGEGIDFRGGTQFAIDLSHALGLPSLSTFGIGIDALEVALDGDAQITSLEAAPRVPDLDVGEHLDGRRLGAAEFLAALRTPRAEGSLRLIVQTAMGAVVVPFDAHGVMGSTTPLLDALRVLARASRDDQVLFWFESLTPSGMPGFARSAIDRFVLAPD